jgi:hypothetical protein
MGRLSEAPFRQEATLDIGAPVTLVLGPPQEDRLNYHARRECRSFPCFDEAIRYAVETMPRNRRYGAFIEAGLKQLGWRVIHAAYRQLPDT